jgi:hypothetical protein
MLTGVALLFAALLLLPPSAYADPFTVTAGKDIYGSDERVIVAGTLPDEGDGDVRVQITKDDRQCALHTVRPDHDRSFVSRPLNVANCGPGEYVVTAHYHGEAVKSTFVIAADQQDAYSDDLHLRTIKRFILQAQEVANGRIQEVVNSGVLLPSQAAEAHRKGVVETSLALQALQHGDASGVRGHQAAAVAHFREVLAALAPERLAAVATMEQQTTTVTSGGSEKLSMLQDLYGRLTDLAEKNDVRQDFGNISSLLSQAEELIDRGDAQGADKLLEDASVLLEQARAKLVAQAENSQAKRILASADKLEKRAEALLEKSDNQLAGDKINETLSLVKEARAAVAKGDYSQAREHLSMASKALNEAKKAIGN